MLLYVFYTFLRRVSRLLTYDAQRYADTRTSVDCVCSALPESISPQKMTLNWTDSTMPYFENSRLSASELSGRSNIPRHRRCRRGPKGIRRPQAETRISPLRQCTHQAQAAILPRTLLQKIAAADIVPNLLGDTVLDPLDIVPGLQLTFVMMKLMLLCLTPTTTINPRMYQDAGKRRQWFAARRTYRYHLLAEARDIQLTCLLVSEWTPRASRRRT